MNEEKAKEHAEQSMISTKTSPLLYVSYRIHTVMSPHHVNTPPILLGD